MIVTDRNGGFQLGRDEKVTGVSRSISVLCARRLFWLNSLVCYKKQFSFSFIDFFL